MKFGRAFRAFNARSLTLGLAALAGLVSSSDRSAVAADAQPSQVNALYKISLAGFEIGDFRFSYTIKGNRYSAKSDVELSALLGAFHWKGVTRGSGSLTGLTPKPAEYDFRFESNTKSGLVQMGFEDANVALLTLMPQGEVPPPDMVPLTNQHMKSVLDPMAAIMALTRDVGQNPCVRKVAIFDGKQRFDLALSNRRQETVVGAEGLPVPLTVCRIRYVPIGGYRANSETKAMSENTDIEIALRRVPNAGLVVPHRVTIPTIAGSISIDAVRVDINTPGRGQFALGN